MNVDKEPFMFGKQEITCGYCKKTLPSKYCKRHSPKSSVKRTQMYTLEQVKARERAAEIEAYNHYEAKFQPTLESEVLKAEGRVLDELEALVDIDNHSCYGCYDCGKGERRKCGIKQIKQAITTKRQALKQQDLIDFVTDPETIKRAAEGSMEKRRQALKEDRGSN
ncbi:hypothetical protein [Pseudarthrobacter sp. ATCC 49987]|uniref:hypothetical protein n=1 Tax=Pseudarthrobacter sp. ATCC 49987 TaxID=2698204 RepID=UPI00136C2E24|nr:hypothetical protein [Pseudarthrobacter sp. ATCC 49987]